jgi:hypothetical protein
VRDPRAAGRDPGAELRAEAGAPAPARPSPSAGPTSQRLARRSPREHGCSQAAGPAARSGG